MTEKATKPKAAELKREYLRNWRKNNKDKVAANNRRYWERLAEKALESEKEDADGK